MDCMDCREWIQHLAAEGFWWRHTIMICCRSGEPVVGRILSCADIKNWRFESGDHDTF